MRHTGRTCSHHWHTDEMEIYPYKKMKCKCIYTGTQHCNHACHPRTAKGTYFVGEGVGQGGMAERGMAEGGVWGARGWNCMQCLRTAARSCPSFTLSSQGPLAADPTLFDALNSELTPCRPCLPCVRRR